MTQAIEVATATHTGMVRDHNEDSLSVDAAAGLVILADGMGGYNAGEVASNMAVTLLTTDIVAALGDVDLEERDPATQRSGADLLLEQQIARVNAAIFGAAEAETQCAGMGTTLVMALFYHNRATVAHIGDSRLYRLRAATLTRLTRDHSLLQEQIDCGLLTPAQARYSQNKNLVTRALGIDSFVEPEIHDHEVEPGDIYLFCSDGLNDMVDDEDIALTLQALQNNLSGAAHQLVQMANDNGGIDNISVVLVRAGQNGPRAWAHKIRAWLP